jgi:hypothetical protein
MCWGSMRPSFDEMVAKAKDALKRGNTRGRFIRENSTKDTPKAELQKLSDAYSRAMTELQRRGK